MADRDDLVARVRRRMAEDGVPVGTDNPALLALGARPFRDLCPEADMRDAMTDEEFWAHVLQRTDELVADREWDPDDDPNIPDQAEYELEARLADPCPECGQVGACAYDAEGRALIHVVEEDD